MKTRGIKHGQNIEILEELNNIPDGTEIIIDLEFIEKQIPKPKLHLTEEDRLSKLNKLFGVWKNKPDLTEIFVEIDQQRHTYKARNIDSIDNQDNG